MGFGCCGGMRVLGVEMVDVTDGSDSRSESNMNKQ